MNEIIIFILSIILSVNNSLQIAGDLSSLKNKNTITYQSEVKTQESLTGEATFDFKAYCYKKDVDDDQNDYVRYASMISNNDIEFLATLEAENGLWTPDRIGVTGDIGFCQISPRWHSEIVSDKNFYNPYWQLDKCWELYKNGVTFYGRDKVNITKQRFVCP